MTLYLFLLCFTAFGFAYALSLIDSMHFFQLNSYRFDTHTKWMRQNTNRFMPHNLLAVLLLIVTAIPMNIRAKLILALLLLILAVFAERPKKAKKPLVYTPRVKRMLVTATIVTLLACGIPALLFLPPEKHHESLALLARSRRASCCCATSSTSRSSWRSIATISTTPSGFCARVPI